MNPDTHAELRRWNVTAQRCACGRPWTSPLNLDCHHCRGIEDTRKLREPRGGVVKTRAGAQPPWMEALRGAYKSVQATQRTDTPAQRDECSSCGRALSPEAFRPRGDGTRKGICRWCECQCDAACGCRTGTPPMHAWTKPSLPTHSPATTREATYDKRVDAVVLGGEPAEKVTPQKRRCWKCKKVTGHRRGWCGYDGELSDPTIPTSDAAIAAWLAGREEGAEWAAATYISGALLERGCTEGHSKHGSTVGGLSDEESGRVQSVSLPTIEDVLDAMAADTDDEGAWIPPEPPEAQKAVRLVERVRAADAAPPKLDGRRPTREEAELRAEWQKVYTAGVFLGVADRVECLSKRELTRWSAERNREAVAWYHEQHSTAVDELKNRAAALTTEFERLKEVLLEKSAAHDTRVRDLQYWRLHPGCTRWGCWRFCRVAKTTHAGTNKGDGT